MKNGSSVGELDGLQKAAVLLITLGPEKAANIFKHLKEEEIEQLTLEIANTRSVSPSQKEEVLNEFYEVCLAQQYIAEGGIGYAKDLLQKALGEEKAKDVLGKLTASLQVRPFEFIRKTDASQILNFIQDEHPQTIALILSYLSPSQAAGIVGSLPPDKQTDVAKRIATMDRTSPDVIKEVEDILEQKLASLVSQDYTIVGGVDSVVAILNTVDRGTEKHIMENLEIEEPELADEIRKKMFVFEDILMLDDRSIQRVLRDVENNELAVALKNANEDVRNAIFSNLSTRLADMIREDMEYMGPVRVKDVEEAQQKIVNIIRKLEDSAEIVISRGGGDEIIVNFDKEDSYVIDYEKKEKPVEEPELQMTQVPDSEGFEAGVPVKNFDQVWEEKQEEAREQARVVLEEADKEAAQILEQARQEADDVRQQAFDQGFEEGKAEGIRRGQSEI